MPANLDGFVCFFSQYDSAGKEASFDYSSQPMRVSDEAADYISAHQSELLNHYVMIQTQGQFPSYTVTKLRPVEAHVGVPTDWEAKRSEAGPSYLSELTIDGTAYPVKDELELFLGDSLYENQEYMYFVYGGTIVGLHPVTEQRGVVSGKTADAITVGTGSSQKEYKTVFLLDQNDRDKATVGKPIHYYAVEDFRNYNALLRISNYTTITGKCSTYDVFSHTIFLDGTGYPVKEGYEPDAAALLNARALLVLEDGVVTYADALKNIPVSNIGGGVQTININYGTNGYASTKGSFSFNIMNTVKYPFPAGCDKAVVLADEYFEQDFSKTIKDVTLKADDGLTLKLEETPSGTVRFGEQKAVNGTASVSKSYDPVANDDRLSGSVTYTMQDSDGKTYTASCRVNVNINESAEVLKQQADKQKQKEEKAADERKKLASHAAGALKKMFDGNTMSLNVNTMMSVFGFDIQKTEQFEQELLATMLVSQIPEKLEKDKSLSDDLTEQLMDKLMGAYKKYKDDVGATKYTIPLYYTIKTKDYGTVQVRFDCELSSFSLNKQEYAAVGTIYFQIVKADPTVNKTIPYQNSRQELGALTKTDTKAFCDAAYDLVMRDLKDNYNTVYGSKLDEAADLLLDEPIKAIMKEREITASGKFWEFMEWPTKTTVNRCPTDVYVYDATGKLCGAIENNQVTLVGDDLVLWVEGDAKHVEQMTDDYTVVYAATGSGKMDVIVTEYGGAEKPLRTIAFENVPLQGDSIYRQWIDSSRNETTEEYSLFGHGGTLAAADRDEIVWQFPESPAADPDPIPAGPDKPTEHTSGNQPSGKEPTPAGPSKPAEQPSGNQAAAKNPFTDVAKDAYYYDAVLWAVNNKITDGTTDTTFSPDANCTRAQMVTFLWRAKGSPEPTGAGNPFSDVRQEDYFCKAVLWAVQESITNGTGDTTFSPNETVTRAQTVTFLWRMEGLPVIRASNPFTDVDSGQYYTDAVLWAVKQEITNGTGDTTFSPFGPCTRAQIVTFLYRDLQS